MTSFRFGDIVVDTVTEYVGEITARIEYANGDENQYKVESIDSTGRPIEAWIQESRLMPYEDEAEEFEAVEE